MNTMEHLHYLAVGNPITPGQTALSATVIYALLLTALVVDWMAIGPAWLNDRLAFLLALPAIKAGWQGGPVERWTLGWLTDLIRQAQKTGNTTLAQAAPNLIIGVAVGVLFLYTVGVLIPEKWGKKVKWVGGIAQFTWKSTGHGKLNKPLWMCAIALGVLADQPQGAVGATLRGLIEWLSPIVKILPGWLFGVA